MENAHYVYVMVPKVPAPDRMKVGMTSNIQARRRSIEAACGQPLVIIWALELPDEASARKAEALTHERLGTARLKGEWFEICPHGIGLLYHLQRNGLDGFKGEHVEFRANVDTDEMIRLGIEDANV